MKFSLQMIHQRGNENIRNKHHACKKVKFYSEIRVFAVEEYLKHFAAFLIRRTIKFTGCLKI